MSKLFDGYNALIRPVNNMSELLSVQFQMAMHQLIDVVRMGEWEEGKESGEDGRGWGGGWKGGDGKDRGR